MGTPNIISFIFLVLLFNSTISNGAAVNSNSSDELTCIINDKNKTTYDLMNLLNRMAVCMAEKNYDEAIYLYARAGASGLYDQSRVKDKTAHGARFVALQTLIDTDDEITTSFKEHLQKILGDDTNRQQYCNELKKLPSPEYYPAYMVNHGMSTMARGVIDSNQLNETILAETLHTLENPQQVWIDSVNNYLLCP